MRRRVSGAVVSSRSARVLTTPPYPIEDAATGVNFRWYLANAVLRQAGRDGAQENRTVFLSLHADSLHPAVRGTMVYVPGEKFLNGTLRQVGRAVRVSPRGAGSAARQLLAQGAASRPRASPETWPSTWSASFRAAGLPLHAFDPIRRNVIRGGREWVPAILRYNRIPARVLVEVCNLNNPDDRRLLQTAAYREKVAEALVEALVRFYGGQGREDEFSESSRASTRDP